MLHTQRRYLLISTGALLLAPLACLAQNPQTPRRIGLLAPGRSTNPLPVQDRPFNRELARLGYASGKNLRIESRFPASSMAELPGLADELVRLKVELIVAIGNETIMPASRATRDIPIVMVYGTHPVENGWVTSLARPGGNLTGVMWADPSQSIKSFELLREAAPRAVRIAVTFNPTYPFAKVWLDGYERAAATLGMTLLYFPITRPEDIDPVLERVAGARPDALFVSTDAVQGMHAGKIGAFAIERKLLVVSNIVMEQGILLVYRPDLDAQWERTASFVDRILRGAKPADLPVEFPTKFQLIVNNKTARAINYKIPQSLISRADKIIE